MTTIKFKAGDLVFLRGGGPIMTVHEVCENTGKCHCMYFEKVAAASSVIEDRWGELKKLTFEQCVLDKPEPAGDDEPAAENPLVGTIWAGPREGGPDSRVDPQGGGEDQQGRWLQAQ